MAERRATVRLVATGDRSVRDALNGVTRAVQASSREQTRLAREQTARERAAARERTQVERAAAREKEKLAREESRRVERAERERVAAARRAAREELRISEQTARTRAQQERQAARERQRLGRERDQQRSALGQGILAAGSVAVSGATQLFSRAQSTAGVGSLEERVRAAGEFGTALFRFGASADISASDRDALGQRILSTSDRTGIRSGELLAGLESAQSRFGPEVAMDLAGMLDQLADASVATGSSIEDLTGLLGTVQTAYRLNGEELREFLGSTIEATRAGSIDAKDFAGNFASTLAIYAETSGRRSLAGAREAVGLAEVVGSGQFGAAESATRMEGLLRELSQRDVQQRFRRAGVRVADAQGNLLPLEQIAAQVASSRQLSTQRGISGLRLRAEAEQALLRVRAMGAAGFQQFAGADAARGNAYVRDASAEMLDTPYQRLIGIGTQAENATIRDADRIIETYRETVQGVTELQSEFPILTEVMGTLTASVQALIPALLISAGMRGGGASALGGAATTAARAVAGVGGGALLTAGGIALGGAALAVPLIAATAGTASDSGVRTDDEGAALQARTDARRALVGQLSPEARAAFLGGLRGLDTSGRQRAIDALGQQGNVARLSAAQASSLITNAATVRLAPESVEAIAAASRSALPEGTAGEGAPGRGRRSGEAPHARR